MTNGTVKNKAALESVRIFKRAARLIKDGICEVQYHISKSSILEQIRDKDLTQQWVPHAKKMYGKPDC